jgi:toxin-antitoxin system PIN domain toxin
MKRQLPDVNVLLALIWPRHLHYRAAQSWFDQSGHQGWATNPLTQLGVLRLLTNYAAMREKVDATTASSALKSNTQHQAHEFWPLDRTIVASLEPVISRVRGHKQWTDALLLCQAAERDGILVTFDAGVKELAPNELKDRVLLLNSAENQVNGAT